VALGGVLGVERAAHLAEGGVGILAGPVPLEHRAGLRLVALEHEEARGLRQPQGDEAVDETGNRGGDEHPAPRGEAEPQGLRGAARRVREQRVGEQGREDADGDRELLQRSEPAAQGGGRDLGDV